MRVVGNAIQLPRRRNDHLETQEKFWRKRRRLALHSPRGMHPEIPLCSDKLLAINTPEPLSCTTACHTSSCTLWHLWEGKTTAGFHNMGYIPVTRQFISPSSEPLCCSCSINLSLSCLVHFPPSMHQRVDRALVQWLQTKHWSKLQKTFKPSQHWKLFSSVTKLALTCTRILISPKEGHGAKVFYQSEQQIYHLGTIQITKEPSCKKTWIAFEICALVENCWASATPASAFHQ